MNDLCRSFLPTMIFATAIFRATAAHPADFLRDNDGLGQEGAFSWSLDDLDDESGLRREEALEKLQKVVRKSHGRNRQARYSADALQIFGIRGQSDKPDRHKVPPQFMMELYNTIADPSGITRGRNPYNAKVVRSFIERDTSLSQFYLFNISGLEVNESILEAELHLYRKKMSFKDTHPSILASPYYLIRVYQVLDESNLDVPSLHRLLSVRSVSAHASGWQVFNVKKAALAWLSGEPNLGLLVTASNLLDEEVAVEFSRRSDYHRSKQPILVLFDDDGGKEHRLGARIAPRYYSYGKKDVDEASYDEDEEKVELENAYDSTNLRRNKRQKGQPEVPLLAERQEAAFYRRQKRIGQASSSEASTILEEGRGSSSMGGRRRRRRGAGRASGFPGRIVSRRSKFPDVLTSMDIYERAMLREKLAGATARQGSTTPAKRRDRRLAIQTRASTRENATGCVRHELYVDFHEIGLSSSVIAPKGYAAYHCKGLCEPPLGQDPTNHATVQSIVHKMGLVEGVERPCCVPTKLLATTILFYDDNENVILKVYEDMVAERCGCR